MPNDTLDEIEARYEIRERFHPIGQALGDLRTTIKMVRARDRVVEAADALSIHAFMAAKIYRSDGLELAADHYNTARAALDTPPAQESTE